MFSRSDSWSAFRFQSCTPPALHYGSVYVQSRSDNLPILRSLSQITPNQSWSIHRSKSSSSVASKTTSELARSRCVALPAARVTFSPLLEETIHSVCRPRMLFLILAIVVSTRSVGIRKHTDQSRDNVDDQWKTNCLCSRCSCAHISKSFGVVFTRFG